MRQVNGRQGGVAGSYGTAPPAINRRHSYVWAPMAVARGDLLMAADVIRY
jgi:hypothetical protein